MKTTKISAKLLAHNSAMKAFKLVCGFTLLAVSLFTQPASGSTLVGNNVSGTWTIAGSPYIAISSLTVPGGETLSISPGVQVMFRRPYDGLTVGGHLYCNGKADSIITFTTESAAPVPGSWRSIDVGNTATMNWTEVLYAGYYGAPAVNATSTLTWNGGSCKYSGGPGVQANSDYAVVDLRRVVFRDNGSLGSDDISKCGLYLRPYYTPPLLDDLTFINNEGFAAIIQSAAWSIGTLSGSGNGYNAIRVEAALGAYGDTVAARWEGNPNMPYTGWVIVQAGSTLELGAGAVMKGMSVYCNEGSATLRALGEPDAPIWFTTFSDDEHGGDSNAADGSVPSGEGPRGRVSVDADTVELRHTFFRYGSEYGAINGHARDYFSWVGGGSSHSQGVGASIGASGRAEVAHLTFDNNASHGLVIDGYVAPPTIESVMGTNNKGYPVMIGNPGNLPASITGSNNRYNGIHVSWNVGGFNSSSGSYVWANNPELPYVIKEANLYILNDDTLSIQPGAVVKSAAAIGVYGTLLTAGVDVGTPCDGVSEASPVWFTSLKDDSRGGDTNGDAGVTSPTAGDWAGIFDYSHAVMRLSHTWVLFAGADVGSGAVNMREGTLIWTGGGIIAPKQSAISMSSPDSVFLSSLLLAQAPVHGANVTNSMADNSRVRLSNCDLSGCAGYGFRTASTLGSADVRDCWWGDASGPLDANPGNPDHNPSGLGSAVTDYADYRPFLVASPGDGLPPGDFVRLNPLDGATIQIAPIQFHWSSSAPGSGGGLTYELLVDDDPAFNSPEIDVPAFSGTTHLTSVPLTQGLLYFWMVTAVDSECRRTSASNGVGSFVASFAVSGVPQEMPDRIVVGEPSPNPTRGATSIDIYSTSESNVDVIVLDVAGRRVRQLGNRTLSSGANRLIWDGTSNDGTRVADGIYYVRLVSQEWGAVKRVILLGNGSAWK